MKELRPIMFVGTGSDVGKSVINAGFCRILKQDGYTPAPFKAQNMSLNSYATLDGLEIGRAQAVQAEACNIPCSVEMNPVLLKPTNYISSQVIINGKPTGNKTASEYFTGTDRDLLFNEAMKSYVSLAGKYNPIVIEGAGSISEINLWEKDITNMRVALKTNAATFLIADIDKGGVFASVYGTLKLIPEDERKLIKGIIINKFRGDINLFTQGKIKLEEITGRPVVGIIPYYRDIFIDQEDSVVIEKNEGNSIIGKINIAIILLPHMSNFTDFNMLERIDGVNLYYASTGQQLTKADIIIIPGTKNTISDLEYLRNNGIAKIILQLHDKGKQVYGICGGYQIMGQEIYDPDHVEGDIEIMPGLSILPIRSVISKEKYTKQCTFSFLGIADNCKGYEIHMGETTGMIHSPLCKISDNRYDGYFKNEKVWGTYIHGIFDNKAIIENILSVAGKKDVKLKEFDIKAFKNEQYDKLAQLIRMNTDMDYIYRCLNK